MNVVEVENLSKRYRLGDATTSYGDLRETVSNVVRRRGRGSVSEFWALRDVSFSLREGEVLGVIGRNGAGKSTLLKVLARITEPTGGRARVRGRVGALLEVGTAFHPELTGRENLQINGAILGMTRADISRRFDEIVEFAGIESFLDTPLKRYSSGMAMRLAFSVAAHFEPDIVVVDEVLAVGDAEFQRKCLGKMSELGREGRTVLMVSHDLGAIGQLCPRALWLDAGSVLRDGPTQAVLNEYLSSGAESATWVELAADPAEPAQLLAVGVAGAEEGTVTPRRDEPLRLRFRLRVTERVASLDVAAWVIGRSGMRIVDERWSDVGGMSADLGEPGERDVELTIPPLLPPGEYIAGFWLGNEETTYYYDEAVSFEVVPTPEDRNETVDRTRLIAPAVEWSVGGPVVT